MKCTSSYAQFEDHPTLLSTDWENWVYVKTKDITQFSVDDISDKLLRICATVIPQPNISDDPRNKFVDAYPLNVKLNQLLPSEVKAEFNITGESNYFNELLTIFVKEFNSHLEDALLHRLHLLGELQVEREKQEVKLIVNTIKPILKSILSERMEGEVLVQGILTHLTDSVLNDELKIILSYPIVREELTRSISHSSSNNDEALLDELINTMLPFIHEGLRKQDAILVNTHSTETAERELLKLLIPQYKLLIKNGLLNAKKLDMVLYNSYEENDKIARYIEEQYSVCFRQSMSVILSYPLGETYFPETCNTHMHINTVKHAMNKNLNRQLEQIDVRNALYKKLNEEMGTEPGYITFWDHPTITDNIVKLNDRCHRHILNQCHLYFKIHQTYSKQNSKELAEFVRTLLESKHKDILEKEISILKTQISIPNNIGSVAYDSDSRLNLNISEKLIVFQNDVEEQAIKAHGFLPGMFTYSKPYFDLLETLFPSPVSTENHKKLPSPEKYEL